MFSIFDKIDGIFMNKKEQFLYIFDFFSADLSYGLVIVKSTSFLFELPDIKCTIKLETAPPLIAGTGYLPADIIITFIIFLSSYLKAFFK